MTDRIVIGANGRKYITREPALINKVDPQHDIIAALRGKVEQLKPKHPWVGLTDEELIALSESGLALWELWKAIEAKLKEKNT